MQQWIAKLKLANENCGRRISAAGDSIENLVTSHDDVKRGMDKLDRLTEQAHHARATSTGEVQAPPTAVRQGFFLSGIQQFREIFDMRKITDPFVVAGKLMQEIGSYRAINWVHVADKAVDNKERYKVRAIIIYFNTLFCKNQAAIKLKKFLQRNPKLKATVSDVFPSTETPRALAFTRYAADKRYDKTMTRTRVINKSGTAILRHTEGESKQFKDSVVTEADLDPYYQPRESVERERKADRKRRNRDEKELKRPGQSCPQEKKVVTSPLSTTTRDRLSKGLHRGLANNNKQPPLH
jgi:hypothetical protein